MPQLPKIAITSGDPAGIGPEICIKLLQLDHIRQICVPIILGDAVILDRTAQKINLPVNHVKRHYALDVHSSDLSIPTIIDFHSPEIENIEPGKVSKLSGGVSCNYIDLAIEMHLNGLVDGITTGPINKQALQLAGSNFPGHTEMFAERTKTSNFCMMQYSNQLTCSFVTTHVGYDQVPGLLSSNRIFDVIQLSVEALRKIHNREPAIVVCGLNPHAGENGLFGNREEEEIILPAIEQAREIGIDVSGPLPPDTCFIPSRRMTTDCFVCMYHDQGHIPLKALAFDQAVNLTLGLPIVRTSVDHGTAFDIVGKNLANPNSLIQAVKLASQLAAPPAGKTVITNQPIQV